LKVLIADNYDSFTYNLYHLFKNTGFCTVKVKFTDKISKSEIDWADAIVLSPGPGIASEIPSLLKLTKLTILHKPMLGICLGYQALAMYFGAEFIHSGRIAHGEQSSLQIVEPYSEIFKGIPQNSLVGRYHSWVMDKNTIPDCVDIIAHDNEGNIQAFDHKELPISGFQFHPESAITEYGLKMVENWLMKI
jgi:anthranilate synthase/aminodeoxychorismate synthase-like glutamine amidotransferase